jgi:hypothetical protein
MRSAVDATFTEVVENELPAGEMEAAGVPGLAGQLGADTRSGWESSFTKLDTLLRASLAPDLGTRRP